jgi:hypothetical protein
LNTHRHAILLLLVVLFMGGESIGQKKSQPPDFVRKQVIGITPSNKHRVINGLAIGLSAHPWSTENDTTYVKINGLNVELGPLGIVDGLWGTLFGLVGVKDAQGHTSSFFSAYGYQDSADLRDPTYGTKVNGLSISAGGITETFNKGIIINGLSGTCYKTYGIQVSGLLNNVYEFKGLMMAGISNKATKCNGIQIALINNCKSGRVLQIGLINRIGKRVLPLINFSFKGDKKN